MNFCIIDYKLGNIKSIQSLLSALRINSYLSSDSKVIEKADVVLLPGVGTFGSAINFLKNKKLDKIIIKRFKGKKPIIGICLGMQLFFESSCENGNHKGLALIKGKLKKNKNSHIGWNNLSFYKNNDLLDEITNDDQFYFVHSYFFDIKNKNNIICDTKYGINIPAVVNKDNIFGFQFHPEKSGRSGLKILYNWLKVS